MTVEEFESTYKCNKESLKAIAWNILKDEFLAEDAVQDGLIKAWKGDFNPQKGSLAAYLNVCVRCAALDKLRSVTRAINKIERYKLEPFDIRERQTHDKDELIQWVIGAVSQLPAKHREAIEMAYFNEMMFCDVARALNIPEGSAKSRIVRGLMRLRRMKLVDKGV